MTSKKKSTDSPSTSSKYSILLNVAGRKSSAVGASIAEALLNIEAKGKGRGILSVSKGKKTKDKVLTPMAVSKLTSPNRVLRQSQVKQVAALFDL